MDTVQMYLAAVTLSGQHRTLRESHLINFLNIQLCDRDLDLCEPRQAIEFLDRQGYQRIPDVRGDFIRVGVGIIPYRANTALERELKHHTFCEVFLDTAVEARETELIQYLLLQTQATTDTSIDEHIALLRSSVSKVVRLYPKYMYGVLLEVASHPYSILGLLDVALEQNLGLFIKTVETCCPRLSEFESLVLLVAEVEKECERCNLQLPPETRDTFYDLIAARAVTPHQLRYLANTVVQVYPEYAAGLYHDALKGTHDPETQEEIAHDIEHRLGDAAWAASIRSRISTAPPVDPTP